VSRADVKSGKRDGVILTEFFMPRKTVIELATRHARLD
jgi:hypothetical protein